MSIAFLGNFETASPTAAALNAAKSLLECGVSKGELGRRYRLVAASQISSTVSPGKNIYDEIQNWSHYRTTL